MAKYLVIQPLTNEYEVGDIVELTDRQAEHLINKVQLVIADAPEVKKHKPPTAPVVPVVPVGPVVPVVPVVPVAPVAPVAPTMPAPVDIEGLV